MARVVALIRALTPKLIGREASQHQAIVRELPKPTSASRECGERHRASTVGLQGSPHNPADPLATVVSAHFAATLHDFVHLEYAWGEAPFWATLLQPAERIVDGELVLPLGPGLGAQLSAAALTEHGSESERLQPDIL